VLFPYLIILIAIWNWIYNRSIFILRCNIHSNRPSAQRIDMNITFRKFFLTALLAGSTTLALAACPTDLDPALCRYSITSTSVSGLGPYDVGGYASSTVSMNYDLATDNGVDVFGTPYKGARNYWNVGQDYEYYIRGNGPLGAYGPIGANGPLGAYGPVINVGVNNTQSPNNSFPTTISSQYIYTGSSWCSTACYGPNGPLGQAGPLNPVAYHRDMAHLNEYWYDYQDAWDDYNDFPHQLDAAGVWGILGPLGPLGALGPTGPLGPMNALAINRTAAGDYVDNQNPAVLKRAVAVVYQTNAQGQTSALRNYDLYEMYTKTRAQQLGTGSNPVNDTSFGVVSPDINVAAGDNYLFNSKYTQWLAVAVVPGSGSSGQTDNFNFTLWTAVAGGTWKKVLTANNATLASGGLISFAMVRVKQNEQLKLTVTTPDGRNRPYNLYVTGSGFAESTGAAGAPMVAIDSFGARSQKTGANRFNITGNHQRREAY
jgi:hypothetical protein